VTKQLSDIVTDMTAAFRAAFGAGINTAPQSRFGQAIGIVSGALADIWSGMQQVYNSQYPDTAGGVSQDNINALTGALRLQPVRSIVTETLVGTPSTAIPFQTIFQVPATQVQFRTTLAVTLPVALASWIASTVYALGARVTLGGNVYQATVAGTSAGSGGPTGTGSAIVDGGVGGVTWRYLGSGTTALDVACEAVLYGPNAGPALTITGIVNPVAGLNNVINLADATLGRNVEDDPTYRARREAVLRATGNAAAPAIQAQLLLVAGVTACIVFENTTSVVDGAGRPPGSVEAVVQGGLDADIRKALWGCKGAGIETFGNNPGTYTDPKGIVRTVRFSRPTLASIYVAVTLKKNSAYSTAVAPLDGDSLVKQAIVNFSVGQLLDSTGLAIFPGYQIGDSVIDSALYKAVFSVTGVTDIVSLFIGTAPSPTSSANIPLTAAQLATFSTLNIPVASS
jgi:uncharacterized phage protein gp47/JayE